MYANFLIKYIYEVEYVKSYVSVNTTLSGETLDWQTDLCHWQQTLLTTAFFF